MNLLDLPGEILQRVFRTFTTVEVARASGTCHKLRAFTPQFIAAPSLPSLQWAVKRWHHAEVLQLSLHPDAEPIHALVQQERQLIIRAAMVRGEAQPTAGKL